MNLQFNREALRRMLLRLPFQDNLKLFLFGVCQTPEVSFVPDIDDSVPLSALSGHPGFSEMDQRIQAWYFQTGIHFPDLSMEDVRDAMGMTHAATLAYFRDHVGDDFRTWKSSMRIAFVKKELLENQDKSIAEIAAIAGFRDRSNFHRQFRQKSGCTPKQWRDSGGHPELD